MAPVGHNGAKAAPSRSIVPAVIGCLLPMGAAGLRLLFLPVFLGRGGASFTRAATTFRTARAKSLTRFAARGIPRGRSWDATPAALLRSIAARAFAAGAAARGRGLGRSQRPATPGPPLYV